MVDYASIVPLRKLDTMKSMQLVRPRRERICSSRHSIRGSRCNTFIVMSMFASLLAFNPISFHFVRSHCPLVVFVSVGVCGKCPCSALSPTSPFDLNTINYCRIRTPLTYMNKSSPPNLARIDICSSLVCPFDSSIVDGKLLKWKTWNM